MIPHTSSAPWQTRGACSEAAIFRLLKRSAQAIVERRSRSGSSDASTEFGQRRRRPRRAAARARSSRARAAARRASGSPGFASGGCAHEGARAVEGVGGDAEPQVRPQDVRHRAPSTRPITRGNGAGRICSGRDPRPHHEAGEQVPRMPSGSQVPVARARPGPRARAPPPGRWARPRASGAASRRGRPRGAVADRGRLLLECAATALGRRHGGDRPPHVAAGADLRGRRRDQPLVSIDDRCR